MPNKNIVRLKIISSALTPEQITDLIGLNPDRSWKIGDLRFKTTIREKTHCWILNSNLPKSAAPDLQVEKMVERLSAYADAIRRVSDQCEVYMSCAIYSDQDPPLFFDKTVIRRLGEMGASLDLDLYIFKAEDADRTSDTSSPTQSALPSEGFSSP